jgi:hypothetical protein
MDSSVSPLSLARCLSRNPTQSSRGFWARCAGRRAGDRWRSCMTSSFIRTTNFVGYTCYSTARTDDTQQRPELEYSALCHFTHNQQIIGPTAHRDPIASCHVGLGPRNGLTTDRALLAPGGDCHGNPSQFVIESSPNTNPPTFKSETRRHEQAECARLGAAANRDRACQFAANVLPIVGDIRRAGVAKLDGIAGALNARGVATARGGEWYATSVRNLLAYQTA